MDFIEHHLQLARDSGWGIRDRVVGGDSLFRKGLCAARVHGDSMILRDIMHGNIVIFQSRNLESLQNGKVEVIEKVGDEEGTGAWALKKIRIKRPTGIERNEMGDEIDWEDPVIVLHSYNTRISPLDLDPTGRYRVHGRLLRCLPAHSAVFVDSETLRRRKVMGQD